MTPVTVRGVVPELLIFQTWLLPRLTLALMVCAAEEAPRFGAGTVGSRQLVGTLSAEALTQLHDADGVTDSGLTESASSPVPRGERDLAAESMFEYGSRVGFWRLMRIFAERNLPMTVYACALALERHPPAAAAIKAAGIENVGMVTEMPSDSTNVGTAAGAK